MKLLALLQLSCSWEAFSSYWAPPTCWRDWSLRFVTSQSLAVEICLFQTFIRFLEIVMVMTSWKQIPGSLLFSRSTPKGNGFLLGPCPILPPSFMEIHWELLWLFSLASSFIAGKKNALLPSCSLERDDSVIRLPLWKWENYFEFVTVKQMQRFIKLQSDGGWWLVNVSHEPFHFLIVK